MWNIKQKETKQIKPKLTQKKKSDCGVQRRENWGKLVKRYTFLVIRYISTRSVTHSMTVLNTMIYTSESC